MTVVLSGARGFIGSHVANALRENGYRVVSLVRPGSENRDVSEVAVDLSSMADCEAVLKEYAPRFVLHLASRVRPGRGDFDVVDAFENEVVTAANIARATPLTTELALFFGSCEEYGDSKPPFVENQTLQAFSAYGWGKISAHYAVSLIARERALNWCWLRPFLTFGEGQKTNSVIPHVIRGCLRGETIDLTAGEQTRDFLYVKDLCKMILTILERPHLAKGEILNLCSQEPRKIRAVGETIRKIIGQGHLRWGAVPYRNREAMEFFGSRKRFDDLFGPFKTQDFATSLEATIEHARSQISK